MTSDNIIRMLQECGFGTLADHPIMTENMMRFAALVASAEREACAKACEWEAAKLEQWPQRDVLTVRACAAAIRARGET